MEDIVCIKTFATRMDAEVAKSKLMANSIQSFIEADDAGGAYPFPLSGHMKGIRLFVAKKYAQQAQNLLKSLTIA